MKKAERVSSLPVGGSSLLVIFGTICLTVLALLSVSTVLAQQRMADSVHRAVTAWYEADLKAERIFAGLRRGETIPEVSEDKGVFRYSCPISQHQQLEVELQKTEEGWEVLRWQAVAYGEAPTQALPVWNGQ